jgi:CMP-N,N'-diacetyllegionaminic acid synthase
MIPLTSNSTCIGLIPARAGSKRITGKNVRELAGHPMIAYTIAAARASGVFSRVIVSTESDEIAAIALRYGADVPFARPVEMAADISADIDWIRHALEMLARMGERFDCFAILRPTSPFRRAETIRRAWSQFVADGVAESLRAVQKCTEHPAKQWIIDGARMRPVMSNPDAQATPWHSSPYQVLPPVYVQNASLEIARCEVPLQRGTIAGLSIMPFLTEGLEGFDLNIADDWILAEHYASSDPSLLPIVNS